MDSLGNDTPIDEYERQIARRRDMATVRLTNMASLGIVLVPVTVFMIAAFVSEASSGFGAAAILFAAIVTGLPAGLSAVYSFYDWPVLSRGKIALGLLPWQFLVLGSTLLLLGKL
jgi:hypothetical protein